MPGPLGHDVGDVLVVDLLAQVDRRLVRGAARLGVGDLLLELRDLAVPQLSGLRVVELALRALELRARLVEALEHVAVTLGLLLLALPLRLHARELLVEVGELADDLIAPGGRGLVLLHRHVLDLELDDAAADLVDLGRERALLDRHAGGGLVDQVDRLVGQEAVGDVAVAERGGRDQGGIGDLDAVVGLVALLESAQDRDRGLDARLADHDRLEAPLERGVLLDVLAVLVERGGADGAQLAAGEHRLEQVGGVDCALGGAGADDRVQLVHEQDHLAVGLLDLLEDGLEALLELAAVLGAGEQGADVERDDAPVLERLGHVADDDPLGQAFDDRGLADARVADQHGVVLGAAGEHLDDAADLVVATDDGVELAVLGGLGEVAAEALERLVLLLRVLVGDPVRAADRLDRLREVVAGGETVDGLGERQQQVLGRHVLVTELGHLALGGAEDVEQLARGGGLPGAGRDRRKPVQLAAGLAAHGGGVGADLAQDRADEAILLVEQSQQQVLRRGLGVRAVGGKPDRGLQRLLGLDRETVELHSDISVEGTKILACWWRRRTTLSRRRRRPGHDPAHGHGRCRRRCPTPSCPRRCRRRR